MGLTQWKPRLNVRRSRAGVWRESKLWVRPAAKVRDSRRRSASEGDLRHLRVVAGEVHGQPRAQVVRQLVEVQPVGLGQDRLPHLARIAHHESAATVQPPCLPAGRPHLLVHLVRGRSRFDRRPDVTGRRRASAPTVGPPPGSTAICTLSRRSPVRMRVHREGWPTGHRQGAADRLAAGQREQGGGWWSAPGARNGGTTGSRSGPWPPSCAGSTRGPFDIERIGCGHTRSPCLG